MSNNAASALMSASLRIPAATTTVPNAKTASGLSGLSGPKAGRPNCCRLNTSMWSSRFPKKWPASLSITGRLRATSFSRLPRQSSPHHLRSEKSRCGDRLLRRIAYLGTEPALSPTPLPRGAGRWPDCGLRVREVVRFGLLSMPGSFSFPEKSRDPKRTLLSRNFCRRYAKKWVVCSEPPLGGFVQALQYLGRYHAQGRSFL